MLLTANDKNVIMACHITNIYDVNRNNTLPNDDYSLVKEWAQSIIDLKIQGIIFHNNFSDKTCLKFQNDSVRFIKIDFDARFNPNVYRYLVYDAYLKNNKHSIENLFLTDVSDVVVLQNPFIQKLYIENPNTIFCGDEPKLLNNQWMQEHSAHLRNNIFDYTHYESTFSDASLLNCGIIGGQINVMVEFISKLANLHRTYNTDNQTVYTGDMGAFNYLVRTTYNKRVLYGEPINTVFKACETERSDCWFRHK